MDAWLQESTSRADCGCLVAEEVDPGECVERLLFWLLLHPFQSIEDIVLALGWHPASIYRRITKLEKQGQVETIHDPCSTTKSRTLYLLSDLGITAVADVLGVDANSFMAHRRYRSVISWHGCHVSPRTCSSRVINNLVMRRGHTDSPCVRTTTWKWIPDYRLESIPPMEGQKRIADALVIFSESRQASTPSMRSQAVSRSFLVLVDPGFAGERDRDLIRRHQRPYACLFYTKTIGT